jgi:hypothetical protein
VEKNIKKIVLLAYTFNHVKPFIEGFFLFFKVLKEVAQYPLLMFFHLLKAEALLFSLQLDDQILIKLLNIFYELVAFHHRLFEREK